MIFKKSMNLLYGTSSFIPLLLFSFSVFTISLYQGAYGLLLQPSSTASFGFFYPQLTRL